MLEDGLAAPAGGIVLLPLRLLHVPCMQGCMLDSPHVWAWAPRNLEGERVLAEKRLRGETQMLLRKGLPVCYLDAFLFRCTLLLL